MKSKFLFSILCITFIKLTYGVDKEEANELLFHGAKAFNEKVITDALNQGADVNAQNEEGQTVLMLICDIPKNDMALDRKENDIKIDKLIKLLRLLLNSGADPNIQDKWGNTALIDAVFKGNLGIVSELLKAKNINLDLRNEAFTALELAEFLAKNNPENKNFKLIKDLLLKRKIKEFINEKRFLPKELAEIVTEYC